MDTIPSTSPKIKDCVLNIFKQISNGNPEMKMIMMVEKNMC